MAAVHHPYERTGDVIRLADVLKVVLSRHVDENEWALFVGFHSVFRE